MVIDNLHGPIKEAMVLGDCRKFPQLFERAARMQRSIKDGSITFLRNSSNGGEGKPKNTLRTKQPTQEVTITPDPINAVQAQQNALRQRSTRNQQAIQGAVPQPTQKPPTQSQPQNPAEAPPRPAYNKAAPPANYDPQQQEGAPKRPWGPNRAHYPSLPLPIPTLFSSLLAWTAISLPRDKPLPWPPGLDYFKFCPFHRYAGHTIEKCNTLRDVIYDMNDENRINWNEVKAYLKAANVTEATNMGIYTNPMPQHQGGQVTTQGPTPVQTNPGPSAIHQLPFLFVYFQEVLTRPFF